MELTRGLETLLVAATIAALAPVLVALLPGPRIPQVVLLAGGVVAGPRLFSERPGRLAIVAWLVTVALAAATVGPWPRSGSSAPSSRWPSG